MTINYRSLGRSYLDSAELPEMLKKEEDYIDLPYDDGRHIATIGIGINITLKPYLALVLQKLQVFAKDDEREAAARVAAGRPEETPAELNQRYTRIVDDFMSVITSHTLSRTGSQVAKTSASEQALQQALNTKLQSYVLGTASFSLTEQAAKEVKNDLILGFSIGPFVDPGKQARLDAKLQNNGTVIDHDTAEYKALMSLYFARESLIGPGLLKALKDGNRAVAWYEIRFGSNKNALSATPPQDAGGQAKRRYYESQVFGLYDDPANVTLAEAEQAYRMLTQHRLDILKYEKLYGTDPNGSTPEQQAQRIAAANTAYDLTGTDQVQTLVQAFNAAKNKLIAELPNRYTGLPGLSANNYRSTDILMASDPTKGATLELNARDGDDRSAKNILVGTALDDALTGGKGDDILIGEKGYDTYYWKSGDGNDIIVDQEEIRSDDPNPYQYGRIIYVDANNTRTSLIGGSKTAEQSAYQSTDQRFTYELTGTTLIIHIAGEGGSIILKNFKDGDLGIRLQVRQQTSLLDRIRLAGDALANFLVGTAEAEEIQAFEGDDWVEGKGGRDRIEGNEGKDNISGGAGNDILDGGAGDDTLRGSEGYEVIGYTAEGFPILETHVVSAEEDDEIDGGLGNDTIWGEGGADMLHGGPGTDLVVGGEGDDVVYGDEGDDTLWGVEGHDQLYGGPGQDHLWGDDIYPQTLINGQSFFAGDDLLDGGEDNDALHGMFGNDVLLGGDGDDRLEGDYIPDAPSRTRPGTDFLDGGVGNDTLLGDSGDDTLFGDSGDDVLWGDTSGKITDQDGNDYLDGGDGNDQLRGEGGTDVLLGDDGNDELHGGAGDDTLLGGAGQDSLWGDTAGLATGPDGNDSLDGGDGDDQLVGEGGDDALFGSTGNDKLFGLAGQDSLYGGDDQDELYGGDDNDVLSGDAGNDMLQGNDGDDDLAGGEGADQLVGGRGNDTLSGDAGDDFLQGDDGDDQLTGGDGTDQLLGRLGNDTLDGEVGDDLLWGDEGNDQLTGGGGNDQLVGGAGNDTLVGDTGDDLLWGDDGDDQLTGGDGNDQLHGGLGNDILVGEGGNNLLWGDEGNDQLMGGDGMDQLIGGLGNDSLVGDTGNDVLLGNDGDDVLEGGAGNDQLVGGAGRDTFIGGAGTETIVAEAQDKIVLALGDGQDFIKHQTGGGLPAFSFVDGIRPEDLQIDTGEVGTDPAQYLFLTYGTDSTAPDRVLIQDGGLDLGQTYTFGDITLTQRELMQYATASLSLEGNDSSNSIYGGPQGDYLYSYAGDDSLYGERGNDGLYGDAGNDTLDGGPGNDWLIGDEGNDTYRFGRSSGIDLLTDGDATPGNTDTILLDSDVLPSAVALDRQGYDLILTLDQSPTQLTSRNYFLETTFVNGVPVPDYYKIERIVFGDGTVWDQAAMAPRIISGPVNTMTGGRKDDLFVIDNTLDTVVEGANQGIDTIQSRVTYTLPANVEKLTLTGYLNADATGNSLDNVLTGNSGNNDLNGMAGADTLIGGAGDDRYIIDQGDPIIIEAPGEGIDWVEFSSGSGYTLPANVENITAWVNNYAFTVALWGNSLDNTLIGVRNGATYLDGGPGADTLVGGLSDDTYIVDNSGDTIVEEGYWSGGVDTVRSSVSYTLVQGLENLQLTGSDPISGTGNGRDNRLDGSTNSAANVLRGGPGNDTYLLGPGDTVVEDAAAGTDSVILADGPAGTYTLDYFINVENLTLNDALNASNLIGNDAANSLQGNASANVLSAGAGNDTLGGYAQDDTLLGGAGDDRLYGGVGSDTYEGGTGNDQFYDYVDTSYHYNDADTYRFGRGDGQDTRHYRK